METTATTPNRALPPKFNETDPAVAAADKLAYERKFLEGLREELKDWRNSSNRSVVLAKANQDHFWKRYDFHGKLMHVDMPKVATMEEVEAYADQGIPTWLMHGDSKTAFGPQALFNMVHEAQEFQRREIILTVEAEEAKASNRLKSVTDMLKTPEINWLVQDKIHATGLCQIFGASYAGKTVLTLDLVMSWCAGLPEWQGYKLNNNGESQDAVYVAAEGGAAVSVHVDAWLKFHSDVDPSRLDGLLFLDGGDGDHMFLGIGKAEVDATDSWAHLQQEIITANIAPSLMVFDTQIDLAPGVDENSNTDMVGVLREVKRLGDTFGFMAIVIHHTGHDGNKARGASGMMGKCDSQAKLTVIGEKSGKAKLEWTKVKGRAIPKDSISYHIQGVDHIPDLNSEGAVCIPIGKMEAVISEYTAKQPDPDTIRQFMVAASGKALSRRSLADAVGIDRNNKGFKDAVDWMIYSAMLQETGEGRNKLISLAPFAVVPEDPSING
ncbi:AAA family ATPase [Arthrobacter sp. CJ23]|uniref:AAA family ATPase n=1 Tax=Arthrobacter sp. CJ23 TaxID=2972479 RepID=UPI00215BB76C|nr:AAA family ATPase [Arthrobacter sp. CJ23]UVJ37975.1 AAA family ATPase [Arthrobacter sp. CJ23]